MANEKDQTQQNPLAARVSALEARNSQLTTALQEALEVLIDAARMGQVMRLHDSRLKDALTALTAEAP